MAESMGAAGGATVPRTPRGSVVLVVDDYAPLMRVLVGVLRSRGLDAEGEVSPRRALERVAADPARFGAVVTDLNMPEMDGFALAEAIRSAAPAVATVVHSAQVIPASRGGCVDAMVPKHQGVDELIRELRVLLMK